MKIESDRAKILSGVRFAKTQGSPIALLVENRDWVNWQDKLSVSGNGKGIEPLTAPRPGHADFAGMIKYGHMDLRNVLERSSARETAMRVAICTIARRVLEEFGIKVISHVVSIGGASMERSIAEQLRDLSNKEIDRSPVRCIDSHVEKEMMAEIDRAKENEDSIGGIFEIVVMGLPVGLGSHVQWDRKLDGRLAQALMSVQAIKGVEVGLGFEATRRPGSEVHDELFYENGRYYRRTNRAGGLEGGMTNGEPLVLRAAMKPLSTLMKPLHSVDMETKEPVLAHKERSDVCAVPPASIVGEAVVAFVLADAFLEKFGGDSVKECGRNLQAYRCRSEPVGLLSPIRL